MGLLCAKSLFHQYPKTQSFPGVFLSGTRNPGFKILSQIGNTTDKMREEVIVDEEPRTNASELSADKMSKEVIADEESSTNASEVSADKLSKGVKADGELSTNASDESADKMKEEVIAGEE